MSKKASIQAIHRQRQEGYFVGRKDEVASFRVNLALPYEEKKYVWHVSGQGGIGKTTLLKRYQAIAYEQGAEVGWVDESQTNILDVINRIVQQFEKTALFFQGLF